MIKSKTNEEARGPQGEIREHLTISSENTHVTQHMISPKIDKGTQMVTSLERK